MYKDIQDTVLKILKHDKKARNNDRYLIYLVLREKGLPTDVKDLVDVGISLESITRSRRLLQASNPELRADKKVQEMRDDLKEEIEAYVTDKGDC